MTITELKELMEGFDSSSLKELQFQDEKTTLYFSKNEINQPIINNLPVSETKETVKENTKETKLETVDFSSNPTGEIIKAPLIGTFYLSPAPKEAPFVAEGDIVKKGQVIGIIEAMKVMNEITAPVAGKVTKIFPTSGSLVEYDASLMEIQEV